MSLYSKVVDLQKLNEAWNHVRKNHPASGVDSISYEDYEENLKTELQQLWQELSEHRYESQPVKEIVLYKGEKARTVALFCMRDKVVHQSLSAELSKLYDAAFSPRVFAYRPGKSALDAVSDIEKAMQTYEYALKLDIVKFFDSINQKKLLSMLRKRISEEDVMDLIKETISAKVLDPKSGTLSVRERGVFQGSSVAPVLSNIYMMEFDNKAESTVPFYVRYADDILVMDNSKEHLMQVREMFENMLNSLDLELQTEKTVLVSSHTGLVYLGYFFDKNGKAITDKAQDSLKDRLEEMWFLAVNSSVEEKLKKGSEIVGGWKQYYDSGRVPGSMLEYAVVLYMVRNKGKEVLQPILERRFQYENIFRDLLEWLVEFWSGQQRDDITRREYEQYFQIDEQDEDISIDTGRPEHKELLDEFKMLLIHQNKECYENLIQLYSDLSCYNKAAALQKKMMVFLNSREEQTLSISVKNEDMEEWEPDKTELQTYLTLFVGREDLYACENMENGRRKMMTVFEALTEDVVRKHLTGHVTLETYIQRPNATVSFFVLDIDISKKILLQYADGTKEFEQYLEKAAAVTAKIQKVLRSIGLQTYAEFSGYRGYHLWLFFTEWIPIRFANMLGDYMESRIKADGVLEETGLQLEFFPNKAHVRADKPGQCIKLPYGVHVKSGRMSYFLTKEMEPVSDVGKYLKNVARYSLKAVKKVLSNASRPTTAMAELELGTKTVDTDLSAFQVTDSAVLAVLESCNLMRYLCQKAKTTGYLGHFERLSVLYVFGHLGDEGKNFVHTVMRFTLNYQYHITEKFIHRLPDKPVSCIKLRDQYKTLTAEFGCSCNFRRTNNCYPSPVLHAIKNADDDVGRITVPTSKTLSKTKEKLVCEELNVPKKIQDMSARILELKKQKRGIDKNIVKLEKELEKIFDQSGVDCMEIEMGLLVRRKTEQGYEWLVEL